MKKKTGPQRRRKNPRTSRGAREVEPDQVLKGLKDHSGGDDAQGLGVE